MRGSLLHDSQGLARAHVIAHRNLPLDGLKATSEPVRVQHRDHTTIHDIPRERHLARARTPHLLPGGRAEIDAAVPRIPRLGWRVKEPRDRNRLHGSVKDGLGVQAIAGSASPAVHGGSPHHEQDRTPPPPPTPPPAQSAADALARDSTHEPNPARPRQYGTADAAVLQHRPASGGLGTPADAAHLAPVR